MTQKQSYSILHLHTELNLTCGISRTIFNIINNSESRVKHHLIILGGDGIGKDLIS